jgi:hypothetical protein
MPPAVIFYDPYNEVPSYHRPTYDDWFGATGGENWEEELVVPGRMVYMGQGHSQFLRIDEVEPGMMWPKRRPKKKKTKKKKASSTPPPPPAPALTPAPIDWGDWEELCQTAPPPPPPPVWGFPYEELGQEVPTPWEPEDWEAEIAASQWEPEDWEAELASQWQPEDWEAELASQWEPEDWEAELSQ